ncbi:MAG: MbnP family copper-binding protein [Bacteroidota bacterium]
MTRKIIYIALTFLFIACSEKNEVILNFEGEINGKPLSCNQWYSGFDVNGKTAIQLKDFRFFISDLRLINSKGQEVPVALEQDSTWQFKNIALLDLENGTGECSEKGNMATNTAVRGKIKNDRYTGIVFKMGIPFEWNHVDNAAVPSPLNVGAMFWNWQSGYKFARFDLVTDKPDREKFWFIHLGSTGCVSEIMGAGPESPCSKTNIPEIRIENFDVSSDIVTIDLGTLLKDIPVGTCMSGTDNAFCSDLFPRFGLSLETGDCMDGCADQQLFRKRTDEAYANVGK